jgi:hypothetical protein
VPISLQPTHDHPPLVGQPVATIPEYPLEFDHERSVALAPTSIKN